MKLTVTDSLLFENQLIELGYRKYCQNFKNSDYTFWKSLEKQTDEDGDKFGGYQIGFSFYDFTKFHQYIDDTPIHINYTFLLGQDVGVDRLEFTITDDSMSIEKFEQFCNEFYHFWSKSKLKKNDLLFE